MTDAEIIKALECCSQDTHNCDNCPLDIAEESLCFNEIKGYALDLINRQKAEIERLKAENDKLAEDWSNLTIEKDQLFDEAKALIEAKVEAIKEFAERLYDKAFHDMNDGEAIVCCRDIDNLVKRNGR